MVEQRAVNALVVGSSPTCGAKKLDTNSFFEDERVRSPGPATLQFIAKHHRKYSFHYLASDI